jgi:hypothetical protein
MNELPTLDDALDDAPRLHPLALAERLEHAVPRGLRAPELAAAAAYIRQAERLRGALVEIRDSTYRSAVMLRSIADRARSPRA